MDNNYNCSYRLVRSNVDMTREDIPNSAIPLHFEAVKSGNLKILREIVESTGIVGNVNLFDCAIRKGDLDIIDFLYRRDCPRYDNASCYVAACLSGHYNVIGYFNNYVPDWTYNVLREVVYSDDIETFRIILDSKLIDIDAVAFCAVTSESIQLLECLIDHDYIFKEADISFYCSINYYDALYLIGEKGRWKYKSNHSIYRSTNNIDIVIFLYESMKIDWCQSSLADAIESGQYEIVEYMLHNNAPMNVGAFSTAYKSGDLETVKILHERGCPTCISSWYLNNKYNPELVRYYHNNIYNIGLCKKDCTYCKENIEEALWNDWILKSNDYGSYGQWFPREIMEDLISLLVS